MNVISRYSTGTWVFISVLLLILITANTFVSQNTLSQFSALQKDITRSSNIEAVLEETHVHLLKAESGQRGFLLTQDERYLKYYQDSVKRVKELLVDAEALRSKLEEKNILIARLKLLIEEKIIELQATIVSAQSNNFNNAIKLLETNRGRVLYDEVHDLFEQIKQVENEIGEQQVNLLSNATQESEHNLQISLIISLLLVIGVFFLARVNIKNQQNREIEMASQNEMLQKAVDERTKELSLFSDELSRSNRELEDFAFVASHDLQEPLRKIMAFGDRLESQSDNLSDKQRDFLKRMRSAANRMSILISDLLEFSRVSTRGKPFQEVDLNSIVQNCIDDLNVLIEETGVSIKIDSLPSVIADPTQMQQLLFNLLTNAIKFSQNEAAPQVSISVESAEQPTAIEIEELKDWICITIKDNGIGFEQEYAEKIFAPFQRLHSRNSFKGTGIGLAICRRIIERHNGIIVAQGNTNEGATFKVTLPKINQLISIKQ